MEVVNTPLVRVRGVRAGRIHKMLSPKTAHQLSGWSPWETEKSKIRPGTTKNHGNKRKEGKRGEKKALDCRGVDQEFITTGQEYQVRHSRFASQRHWGGRSGKETDNAVSRVVKGQSALFWRKRDGEDKAVWIMRPPTIPYSAWLS